MFAHSSSNAFLDLTSFETGTSIPQRRRASEICFRKKLLSSLETDNRMYLCGNLEKPQALDWINTDGLEIGMSDYKEFTADVPTIIVAM